MQTLQVMTVSHAIFVSDFDFRRGKCILVGHSGIDAIKTRFAIHLESRGETSCIIHTVQDFKRSGRPGLMSRSAPS